jgi:hypothetical protein
VADERKDQEKEAGDEEPAAGRETAVGHSVVDEGAGQETSVRSVPDEPPAASGQETSVRAVPDEPPAAPAQATSVQEIPPAPTAAASTPTPPDPGPPPAAAPYEPSGGTSPAAADRIAADSHDTFEQRPELIVAGAFVGAFVIGQILKRLTRGGD